ncbi:hypothetical protein JCM33374_g4191 [Metschnikowia sp. JCM 33374]|nr:hypothetical protein JCM33374_g4191 [Metschnikowia sp. JCM 33374]
MAPRPESNRAQGAPNGKPGPASKYERDQSKFPKKVSKGKSRRINNGIKKVDQEYKEFVKAAEATDMLLQEEAGFLEADGPMERTYKFRQDDIAEAVDISTANKKFDLNLVELGPYTLNYSRNGRRLLLGGKKGHVASIDWRSGALDCELFLNETVHAVQYFHSHQYFAVAQKKYTFIYDQSGMELHRLKQHSEHTLLDFLPYHFLLVGAGHSGSLKYHDVSTGVLVSELRTKLGPTQAMKQNPWNAVMHLGHGNGTVSLWCPTMNKPLVKLQTNRGPVRDLAVDREGKYMAVTGTDKKIKIWDLRKLKELDTYSTPTPANSLEFSDNGLLSVGWGPHVSVWKDTQKSHQDHPYMTHLLPGTKIEKIKYVPFEDILGVGHSKGISSLIIPGAGEANYDSMELNPYESAKQRQELEVKALLNKLRPDTISLDPSFIGTVDKNARNVRLNKNDLLSVEEREKKERENAESEIRPDLKPEQSKLKNYMRKNQNNIMDARKMRTERNLKLEEERREKLRLKEMGVPDEKDALGPALGRFV